MVRVMTLTSKNLNHLESWSSTCGSKDVPGKCASTNLATAFAADASMPSLMFLILIDKNTLPSTVVVAQQQQEINSNSSSSQSTNSSSSSPNPLSLNTIFKQVENSVVQIIEHLQVQGGLGVGNAFLVCPSPC